MAAAGPPDCARASLKVGECRDLVLRLYGEVTEKYEGIRVEPEGWDAVFGVWADKNIAILDEPDRVATWDHTKWVR